MGSDNMNSSTYSLIVITQEVVQVVQTEKYPGIKQSPFQVLGANIHETELDKNIAT